VEPVLTQLVKSVLQVCWVFEVQLHDLPCIMLKVHAMLHAQLCAASIGFESLRSICMRILRHSPCFSMKPQDVASSRVLRLFDEFTAADAIADVRLAGN